MSFNEVSRIELNQDGTVTLFVNVGGFQVGTPVEISGHALQTNGVVATFRAVELMPAGAPEEGVIMVVRGVPAIGSTFTADEPIMVVAQVADVWITKLNLDTGDTKLSQGIMEAKQISGQVNARAAWNSDEQTYHSAYSAGSGITFGLGGDRRGDK
jgi:hypothetical protein